MKLVIDIPEDQYMTLNAKTQDDIVDVIDHSALIKAIKNGTPFDRVLEIIDTVNDDLDFGTKEKGVALLIKEKVLALQGGKSE